MVIPLQVLIKWFHNSSLISSSSRLRGYSVPHLMQRSFSFSPSMLYIGQSNRTCFENSISPQRHRPSAVELKINLSLKSPCLDKNWVLSKFTLRYFQVFYFIFKCSTATLGKNSYAYRPLTDVSHLEGHILSEVLLSDCLDTESQSYQYGYIYSYGWRALPTNGHANCVRKSHQYNAEPCWSHLTTALIRSTSCSNKRNKPKLWGLVWHLLTWAHLKLIFMYLSCRLFINDAQFMPIFLLSDNYELKTLFASS